MNSSYIILLYMWDGAGRVLCICERKALLFLPTALCGMMSVGDVGNGRFSRCLPDGWIGGRTILQIMIP